MESIFQQNAYHILGLDASATSAEITDRFKELSLGLHTDATQEFALDLPLFNQTRNKDTIYSASQKISSSELKLKEFFFWFLITDETDKKAIEFIKQKNYSDAIKSWENASTDSPEASYSHRRSLALLYTMLLGATQDDGYLKQSLFLWQELIVSENFWSHFALAYKQYGDDNCDPNIIKHFKKNIINDLFEIYSNPPDTNKARKYINEFRCIFPVTSAYENIYLEINHLIEQLKIAKKTNLLPSEIDQAADKKDIFDSIKSDLEKLASLGLYQDEKTIQVRDKTCKALIHNTHDIQRNAHDLEKAIQLFQDALKIAYLPELKIQLNHLIKKLETAHTEQLITKPITDLIAAGKLRQAYELIEKCQRKYTHMPGLKSYFIERKKECINILAFAKWKKARDLLSEQLSSKTVAYYKEASQLVYDNLELFNLSQDLIDEIIFDIKTTVSHMSSINENKLEEYRDAFIRNEKERFYNNFENIMLIILIDGQFAVRIYQAQYKEQHEKVELMVPSIIGLVVLLVMLYLWI
jgi:hypothetical protein